MIIKHIPNDFCVEEIYDLEKIKNKEFREGDNQDTIYYYFELEKINYSQFRAVKIIAETFNVDTNKIHYMGTKDKNAKTKQLISIYGIKENLIEKHVEYICEKIGDLNLKYIEKGNKRLNLSDNLGNFFNIKIRDLEKEDVKKFEENFKIYEEKNFEFENYYEKQRFGFANNSHIIGKLILQEKIKDAVKMILTSKPENCKEDLEKFITFIENNFEEIELSNQKIIVEAISFCPENFKEYVLILEHLKKYKNDFYGAFRTLVKKLRTMYVHAYQSSIFNEILKKGFEGPELELITFATTDIKISSYLEKDNLSTSDFKIKSMPELKFNFKTFRKTKIKANNIKYEILKDDLFENKNMIQISFDLEKGSYATNIINILFKT